MVDNWHHKGMTWLLLISNTVLVMIVLVKLQVTPSQILIRLQKAELANKLAVEELRARQDRILIETTAANTWRIDLTESIRIATSDIWKQSDEKRVWEQFFTSNPNITKPDKFWVYDKQDIPIQLPIVPNTK